MLISRLLVCWLCWRVWSGACWCARSVRVVDCLSFGRALWGGGQVVAGRGGPVAASKSWCQVWAQGQSRGRCRIRRRPVEAAKSEPLVRRAEALVELATEIVRFGG